MPITLSTSIQITGMSLQRISSRLPSRLSKHDLPKGENCTVKRRKCFVQFGIGDPPWLHWQAGNRRACVRRPSLEARTPQPHTQRLGDRFDTRSACQPPRMDEDIGNRHMANTNACTGAFVPIQQAAEVTHPLFTPPPASRVSLRTVGGRAVVRN